MKSTVMAAMLSVFCAAAAFGDFAKSVSFTTSGYRGSAPLANFPVLVKLSSSISGFDYADFGGTTNLVFKDSAGNVIPHEVDTWNTSGTSLVWVRVPSVTASATFKMYYCGSGNTVNTPAAVWTAANYVGVWHMDETSGTVADATGHGLTATPMGDASVSVRYSGTDAPAGHARQAGTSVKSYLSIPSYDSFEVGGSFTMSGWVRMYEIANNTSPRLFSRKDSYNSNNGWEIEMAKSDASFLIRGAARDNGSDKIGGGKFNPSLKNKWTHVALVFDGASCSVYSNGYELVSGTVTATSDNNLPLSIGCDSDGSEANMRGAFDECRLLDAVASADWIAAEYATVASDTFVTTGDVEEAGGETPGMMILVR
ncbi:MAG: DUF2341 domain-containing protein [Kiritimatiellae bacterium]|nr:DUF2341 domain-containing protein [Kiritimatiellia bacterium]